MNQTSENAVELLSANEVIGLLEGEIDKLSWINASDSHTNIDSSENWIGVATRQSGHIFTISVNDVKNEDGVTIACSISSTCAGFDSTNVFKKEEEFKKYFDEHILHKFVLKFYLDVTDSFIRKIKRYNDNVSDERLVWGYSKFLVGNRETNCVLTIDGNFFNIGYSDNVEGELPMFTFRHEPEAIILGPESLNERFDELFDMIKSKLVVNTAN